MSDRTVADVLGALAALAPFEYAADWDNVGLLAGRPEWPATRVLLAIDLTDAVAREALRSRVNLLVVYHPPIFKGIRVVTPAADASTTRLPDLLAARIAIIALHTALDAAPGGTNDVLLDAFAPVERYPLEPQVSTDRQYKLVVFVPPRDVDALRRALAAAGAGVIGHYAECSFELAGRGTFRGDETTHPTVGRRQVLEHADEVRLEMIVPRVRLGPVVRALYAAHSYEEPAFDVYPLHEPTGRGTVGLGRIGRLRKPERGTVLLRKLGRCVDLSAATVVGDLRRRFRSVTAAAGAFGTRAFRDPDSLVVTGELKHHDALELLRRGVTAVLVGHHASERPVLATVRAHLQGSVRGLRVALARADRAPLVPVRR
ncbi:MAG TPA: Nif3-like dinuclear metal center hexameric protein [Phycisphaerae bacterium]|nr:Nif3-like dinuclear metal center hexameric protein [Phycisphaerae bacterium]HPM22352.1 Nif3-like dinuclear metal center hexameric protein [Phycisphaerae bacterium]HQL55488.1 Nif3-like dinuclear metal center hexameric protein [Phycisphaerae bacterium]